MQSESDPEMSSGSQANGPEHTTLRHMGLISPHILPRLSKKESEAFTSLAWQHSDPVPGGQSFKVAVDTSRGFILRGVYYEQHGPIVEVSILGEKTPASRGANITVAPVSWPSEVPAQSRVAHGPTD
jgi:hypothetical protein